MLRTLITLLCISSLTAMSGCGPSLPDTLVTEDYDHNEMDAAISRARSEVEAFIAELANPTGEDHAVKAPIEDNGQTEHFWLNNLTYANGQFHGTINNEPGLVGNVKFGQPWTIAKNEISDWTYMKDGMIHGNYTMRPLLKTLPKEKADALRSKLATP